MQFINQHSFVIAAITLLAVVAGLLLHDGVKGRDLVALAAVGVGLTIAWLAVRPTADALAGVEEARAQIGGGTPVLLEIQSPY